MHIHDMNWMQVEAYLQNDDRCVLPIGTTEQHAYLSLCVDNILPEKLAADAAEPLGIPVFPVLPYGLSPYFRAYPGTLNLRMQTYLLVIRDLLDSLAENGFRRILIVNGHGGNAPAANLAREWMADHPGLRVKFHNWWSAPHTWASVQAIDPDASHASWMENFHWTRLPGIKMPPEKKPMVDTTQSNILSPAELRSQLGDGNFGGLYQRSDDDMLAIWQAAVEETRTLLTHNWE